MPYGSARDLPKFVDMKQQLKTMRRLGLLLPRQERKNLRELRSQIDQMADTVDAFYALLGPRNWVFHEDLNVNEMGALTTDCAKDPESAEAAFITWYRTPGRLPHLVQRLHGHEGLRERMHLLQFALDDYQNERYYAVVQVLLSVMDGFVNDLTPANRKGLHARDAEELDAWDSVVGHHLGLTAAQREFTRTFKARSDEPVENLYRNGIVHGMLTNYNNVVVATKAWNRLFAVADWARAVENERREAAKPPDPSWADLRSTLLASAETRAALDAFKPKSLTLDSAEFTSHPVYQAATQFLRAWQERNFGNMSQAITIAWGGVPALKVRNDYQGHDLEDFEVLALNHYAAPFTTVRVRVRVDGATTTPELRWVREGSDGQMAAPNQPGDWRLMSWGYPHMTQDASDI